MSEKPEDAEPIPSTSKENESISENTKCKLSRSVSLSKIEDYQNKETPSQTSRKRKDPPSPKGKVSIKDTKAKFELQEKYRNQRNLKYIKKEKDKFKRNCKKVPTETIEDPIAK